MTIKEQLAKEAAERKTKEDWARKRDAKNREWEKSEVKRVTQYVCDQLEGFEQEFTDGGIKVDVGFRRFAYIRIGFETNMFQFDDDCKPSSSRGLEILIEANFPYKQESYRTTEKSFQEDFIRFLRRHYNYK